ncbi:Cullin binding-domain-containing protein [Bombardia bombarda]|uniref:Defective in cullin neddylation protein n=1 Tax=Bombardia bombarda TaxID=252184 RepID=A0AA39TVR3_9PEZI|nr:Cullin binding-domain-containing protein [Bombardia bombarda]
MSAESIEAYAKLMNVDHLSYELFVVLDIVQAISFSEMTRGGYVDGWKQVSVDSRVPADTAAHRKYVRACIDKLPRDPAYFKRVYQRAFQVGKEPAQKALDKEIAIVFWDMLFGEKVRPWQTRNVNWLDVWKRYLEEKWTRSVNKDMWSQTLHFAEKTMEDETLGFWSEDQAWPGVIDDFVVWCREKGVVKAKADVVEVMEVDD